MAAVAQTSSSIPIKPLKEIQENQAKFREEKPKELVYCGSALEGLYLLAGSVDHIQRIDLVYREKRVEVVYYAWRHFAKEIMKDDILEFYEKSENPKINVLNYSPFWLVFKCGNKSEKIPPHYLIGVDRQDLMNGHKIFFLKRTRSKMIRTI